MSFLWNLLRIISGAVLIFSGFVKGMDPLGSTYKITDYLTSFGWEFLSPAALAGAILLSVCEWTLGVCLLTGVRIRETTTVFLGFMSGFTLLTLYIAITNPVSDCGCFGDALVLTNRETLIKNIFLLSFALILFRQRKQYHLLPRIKKQWLWVILFALQGTGLAVYSWQHLPMIDFLPYSVGTDLEKSMEIPEGEFPNEYRSLFTYEKDGISKIFTEEDYPWNDSTWVWRKTETELVKPGYQPPIHDFSIVDNQGYDYVDELLADQGFSFLIAAWDITLTNPEALKKLKELEKYCLQEGHRFYLLTGSSLDQTHDFMALHHWNVPVYSTDKIQLKTMVRSNPGIVLVKEGVVIGKWHYRDLPQWNASEEKLLANVLSAQSETREKAIVIILLCIAGIALLFFGVKMQRENSGN